MEGEINTSPFALTFAGERNKIKLLLRRGNKMKKICVFILLTLLCPLLLAAKDTAICSFVAESNCEYHVYMPKPWDEGFNFTDKSMDGYDYGLWILNRDKVHDMTLYMKHDVPAPPGYCLIKKICWGEITAKLIPIGIRHY